MAKFKIDRSFLDSLANANEYGQYAANLELYKASLIKALAPLELESGVGGKSEEVQYVFDIGHTDDIFKSDRLDFSNHPDIWPESNRVGAYEVVVTGESKAKTKDQKEAEALAKLATFDLLVKRLKEQ